MSKWLKDTLERTARTFVQGFLSVVTLSALTSVDASALEAAYAGLIAGGFAILTSFAAKGVGDKDSASLLK